MESTSIKKNNLFLFLGGLFITNALVAELIGGKLFSLEKSIGIDPFQITLFTDFPISFTMTAGVILWPFVFILTDSINEYFGREGVKRISYITAILIAYAFFMIWLAIHLTPADFWVNNFKTDPKGNSFDVNYAFSVVLGQGLNIIIGSLVAFVIGQLLDAYIFEVIKKKTGDKYLWFRATGSTLISQFIDSFIVLFIAFYWLPKPENKWTLSLLFSVGLINYCYKFFMAIALTPLLYVSHGLIDRYLRK